MHDKREVIDSFSFVVVAVAYLPAVDDTVDFAVAVDVSVAADWRQ